MAETLLELIRGIRERSLDPSNVVRLDALPARKIVHREERSFPPMRFPGPVREVENRELADVFSARRQHLDRQMLSLRRQVEFHVRNESLDVEDELPAPAERSVPTEGSAERDVGGPKSGRVPVTRFDRKLRQRFIPGAARQVVEAGGSPFISSAPIERVPAHVPLGESKGSTADEVRRVVSTRTAPLAEIAPAVRADRVVEMSQRKPLVPAAPAVPLTELPTTVDSSRNPSRSRPLADLLPETAVRIVNRQPARREVATRQLLAVDSHGGNERADAVPVPDADRLIGERSRPVIRALLPPVRSTPGFRRLPTNTTTQAEHRSAGNNESAEVPVLPRPVPFESRESGSANREDDFETVLKQTAANLKAGQQAQESTVRLLEQITAQAEQYGHRISELEQTVTLRRFNDL